MTTTLLPTTPTSVAFYRILSLPEAARVTGWSMDELQRAIETGKIVAGVLDDGSIAVVIGPDNSPLDLPLAAAADGQTQPAEDKGINERLSRIKREDFAHLEGEPITVSEAARKYGVGARTIRKWIELYPDHVRVLEPSRGPIGAKVNEADIAYLAAIHNTRKLFGVRSGVPLIDSEGNPNLLKHPLLSMYRKNKVR